MAEVGHRSDQHAAVPETIAQLVEQPLGIAEMLEHVGRDDHVAGLGLEDLPGQRLVDIRCHEMIDALGDVGQLGSVQGGDLMAERLDTGSQGPPECPRLSTRAGGIWESQRRMTSWEVSSPGFWLRRSSTPPRSIGQEAELRRR